MFAKQIIDSDAFLEMPLSAQALYFHLSMRADDDGFVDNPRKIQRMVSASGDDLKLLIAKRYILTFDSGVIVIKHWRMHNTLRADRYKETVYLEEKALLEVKKNKSYTERKDLNEIGIPNGNQVATQYRLDKSRLDKSSNYSVCFETSWKEYPRKKEKAKAYSCYKARLKDGYSEDELLQAIKNYASDCKINKTEERYIKLCATFLGPNTPFIDYLGENYKPIVVSKPKTTNKFNQFPQREYTANDYAELEKKLLNKGGKS